MMDLKPLEHISEPQTCRANVTAAHILSVDVEDYFQVEAFDPASKARTTWVTVVTPPDAITAPTNLKVSASTNTR